MYKNLFAVFSGGKNAKRERRVNACQIAA